MNDQKTCKTSNCEGYFDLNPGPKPNPDPTPVPVPDNDT